MATTSKPRSNRKIKRPAVTVTLGLFDTREPIYRRKRQAVPIKEYVPLTTADYLPSGGTPLRDATARFIGDLSSLRKPDTVTVGLLLDESGSMGANRQAVIEGANQFVDGLRSVEAVDPEAAGTVLAVIVTDGYENSSRETTPEQLQAIVKSAEADGFTMIFLGANIDAWSQGQSLGFSGGVTGQTVNYRSTPGGTMAAMASVTADSSSYLSSVANYASARGGSSMRSLAEDGTESLTNSGITSATVGTPSFNASSFGTGGLVSGGLFDVTDAIRKSQETISGDQPSV